MTPQISNVLSTAIFIRSYLNGRHGTGNVQIFSLLPPGFHQCDTIGTSNSLSCVLPRGNVDCSDNVGCMSVESSDGSGHGRPYKILGRVEIYQSGGRCFQNRLDDVGGHNGLRYHGLASTLHPVHRRRFLVRAEVAGQGNNLLDITLYKIARI